MQITTAASGRKPYALAAALLALFSLCVSNTPGYWADDMPDGDYDGYDDVAKDDNDKVIFPKDENGTTLTESKCRSRLFTTGRLATPVDERIFDEFFNIKISEFTWKKNLLRLPEMRKQFKQTLLAGAGKAPAPDVHERLNMLVLDKCGKIIADERFPRTARINCMLLIGDLDQQEMRDGVPASIVALGEARDYLQASAANPALHDALRIAAMVGLTRHAKMNRAGDVRKSLKEAMVQLLSKKEPPAGKQKIGQDWIRTSAADILGVLTAKPEWDEARQPDVSEAILAMSAEKDVDLWMRCQVVGNLRRLDGKSFAAEKVMPSARRLADLALEISTLKPAGAAAKPAPDAAAEGGAPKGDDQKNPHEKKATTNKPDKKKPGPKQKGGREKDDDSDALAALPVRPNVSEQVRRVTGEELTFRLARVRSALTGNVSVPKKSGEPVPETGGLLSAANPDARKFIEELVGHVDKMLDITRKKDLEYTSLVSQLEEARTELEKWLNTAVAAGPGGGVAADRAVADKGQPRGTAVRGKPKSGVNATAAKR